MRPSKLVWRKLILQVLIEWIQLFLFLELFQALLWWITFFCLCVNLKDELNPKFDLEEKNKIKYTCPFFLSKIGTLKSSLMICKSATPNNSNLRSNLTFQSKYPIKNLIKRTTWHPNSWNSIESLWPNRFKCVRFCQ